MSAPNIEMIAASLRKCSLRGGRAVLSPPEVGPPPEEVTVELNSEVALPYQWEQCLDIKTGEIYFVNRNDGTRTTKDPRLSGCHAEKAYCSESSDDDSDDSTNWDEDDDGGDGSGGGSKNYFGTTDDHSTTGETSSSSVYSPGEVTSAVPTDPPVLVAAGCRSCFMYFMVPKRDFTCPKCGGRLLHPAAQTTVSDIPIYSPHCDREN